MTHANEDLPADNDLAVSDSYLGFWDAIPVELAGPSSPTPVSVQPPPVRLRVSAVNETPEPVSLNVEQSDVG